MTFHSKCLLWRNVFKCCLLSLIISSYCLNFQLQHISNVLAQLRFTPFQPCFIEHQGFINYFWDFKHNHKSKHWECWWGDCLKFYRPLELNGAYVEFKKKKKKKKKKKSHGSGYTKFLLNAVDLAFYWNIHIRLPILYSVWFKSYFFKSLKFSLVLLIYSLSISVRVYKANMFECRI